MSSDPYMTSTHTSHLTVSAGDHVNTSECIFVDKSIHLRKTRAHPVERRAVVTHQEALAICHRDLSLLLCDHGEVLPGFNLGLE